MNYQTYQAYQAVQAAQQSTNSMAQYASTLAMTYEMLQTQLDELRGKVNELTAVFLLNTKVDMLRRNLHDYRRTHSICASEEDYYATILLQALVSFTKAFNITVTQPFDVQDPSTIVILKRVSKNDNITLRMVSFYFAHLTIQQLEAFEVWNQPVDHV